MKNSKKSRIKKTFLQTKERRAAMTCKVIECKVDFSTLNQKTKEQLYKLFLEAKWLYNSILSTDNIDSYDTKVKSVLVKVRDDFEDRNLEVISSQMKQGMKTRVYNSLSTLKTLKEKGYKVGKLKFKSEIHTIPLKQHNNTFVVLKKQKRIKIQGIKIPLRVNGLKQLPSNCEIANANLVKSGRDYYVKITIYTEKENKNVPNQSIGIDFGCETQLTLSNGEKIKYQVQPSRKLKKLDKDLKRKVKGSNNYWKCKDKRQKEFLHLNNKRKDIKNKIVHRLVNNYSTICFQDEDLQSWKSNGHGKKIQFSAIGGIISALKLKAVTPIVVDKYYPSTQICSSCGYKQKMDERERIYLCPSCSASMDRDVNAAINILREGLSLLPTERREFKPVEIRTSSVHLVSKKPKVRSTKQETQISLVAR